MSTEIVHQPTQPDPYILSPVMNIALAQQRLKEFQSFVSGYLVPDEDFGRIPGAPKPILLKPGADKLCELYGLADDYDFIVRVEDFDKGLFDYTIKCILTDRRRGCLVATGLGSCNSLEQKYRWRDSKRLCPQCGKEAIIKGKEEYGGGWICFGKKGGCGAKFSDTDESITGQTVGRVANEDIADLKNTILKMAKKRAKVDATLSATRSSGIFTQDIEDMPHFATEAPAEPQKSAAPATAAKKAPAKDNPGPYSPHSDERNEYAEAKKAGPTEADIKMWHEAFAECDGLDEWNKLIVPMMKERADHPQYGRQFIIAAAGEAKKRGYVGDRDSGAYRLPGAKKPFPTVEEYDAAHGVSTDKDLAKGSFLSGVAK